MSDETPAAPASVPTSPAPPAAATANPFDGFAHGDPNLLGAAMLAPGETEPDIDPAGLDEDALRVIRGLRADGFQAYMVGGCVRDLLLGHQPKDFDIATSAHPGEMRSVFRNCRLIGRRFRLAHVYFRNGKIIEVATFRKNPPANVVDVVAAEAADAAQAALESEGPEDPQLETPNDPTPDLLITEDNTFGTVQEDALRRDFTINGLFYDVTLGRVLDYVGGLRDLELRRVRTIGDPEVRMREDPVRLLRAVRFACRLNFEIEPVTYAACEGAVEDLVRCAPPRLLEETFKILRAGASASSFKLLHALGAVPVLLPALDQAMKKGGPDVLDDVVDMLEQADLHRAAGKILPDDLLFAALVEPIARRQAAVEGAGGEDDDSDGAVDQLLEQLIRTSRLPRRIADRVRQLLSAQKVLSGERRRRRRLASFRRTPYFQDALTLFGLRVEATDEHRAAYDAWMSGGEPEANPGAAIQEPSKKPPGAGRRRRGGRGRSRGGNSAPSSGSPSSD